MTPLPPNMIAFFIAALCAVFLLGAFCGHGCGWRSGVDDYVRRNRELFTKVSGVQLGTYLTPIDKYRDRSLASIPLRGENHGIDYAEEQLALAAEAAFQSRVSHESPPDESPGLC